MGNQECNQVLGLVYMLPSRDPCIAVWVGLRICCCDDLLGYSKCGCLLWVHVPARLQTCMKRGVSKGLSYDLCNTGGPCSAGRAARGVPDGPSECCWVSMLTVKMAQQELSSKTWQPEMHRSPKGIAVTTLTPHKGSVSRFSSTVISTWKMGGHHNACEDATCHMAAVPQDWWLDNPPHNHSPQGR